MRIHWDPKAALLCTGVQKDGNFDFKNDNLEPVVALGHEIAHAEAYLNEEFSVYMKRVNTPDPIYDNAEERRVITGIEKHVAQTLKQCVRKTTGNNLPCTLTIYGCSCYICKEITPSNRNK